MSLIATIKKWFKGSNGDRKLVCEDCEKSFVFDAGEQEFFRSKGFTDPKRCPTCRKTVKARLQSRGSRRPNGGRRRFRRRGNFRQDSPYVDER